MKNLNMSTVLKRLMFEKNIKTAELAKAVNLPQQTLQRLVSGITPSPHISTLIPLAEYFSVSVAQLKGLEPIEEITNHSGLRKISFISWQSKPAKFEEKKQNIFIDDHLNEKCFALTVEDFSMAPLFPKGTALIVDPGKEIYDYCYIIVKLHEHSDLIFRQLLIDGKNSYLKSLNTDFAKLPLVKLNKQDEIVGVVVEARLFFVE